MTSINILGTGDMPSITANSLTNLDPRLWRADTAGAPSSWYVPLPTELLGALDRYLAELPADRPITEFELSAEIRTKWSGSLASAIEALEAGRGYVILDRLPLERLRTREAVALYWFIGQLLGVPFEQNVQGTLLYDVRDTGQDLTAGARFSVTSYESSFHTDNSFGDAVLDYVGLLCLKTARSGGVSQNVSGYAVAEALRNEFPGELRVLEQPFHVDRRGGFREGELPTVRRPVIEWRGTELTIRYLRYWIEVGHEKAGEPLTAAQGRALDVLDEVLMRPELRVEFALEPGQMYFINNRWILHNRTAFVDHPEPEHKRHLVRLWLRA